MFYSKIYCEAQSNQANNFEYEPKTCISNEAKSENECESSEKQAILSSPSDLTKFHKKEPVSPDEYKELVRELIERLRLATNNAEKAEILKELKFFFPQTYLRIMECLKVQLNKEKKRNLSGDEIESTSKKLKTKINDNIDEPTCPVCLDTFNEIKNKNNKILSTTCGHIVCSECSNKFYKKAKKSHNINCFECRKNLKFKDIHPVFV